MLGNFFESGNMLFVGTEYGGRHIPKDFQLHENDVCYFFGAGEDISFDCGIASRFPCEIHIFDPTPRAIKHFNKLNNIMEGGDFMGDIKVYQKARFKKCIFGLGVLPDKILK